jgi:RNA polymerase sigma-70 factor (ECF subfamily)
LSIDVSSITGSLVPTLEWIAQVDQLLFRIQRQDKTALKILYDMTSGKLLSIIKRIVKNHEEAEDSLQEVFIKLWQQADKWKCLGVGCAF